MEKNLQTKIDKELAYKKVLADAPPSNRPEFIDYLRDNNEVIWEDKKWIVIKNMKYWDEENAWQTAFPKNVPYMPKLVNDLLDLYQDWEWLKKSPERQTVPGRFHIHFYRPKIK